MDNRLALMDHGSFLGLRALGHQPFTFYTWVYDRPVDLAAVAAFNDHLVDTLLGRLIEPSRLPGGRHRWVAVDRAPSIEVEDAPRPRAAIHDWTNELGDRGLDPQHGPGWRLGVLPLTDGGTAIALAAPHALGDGLCKIEALADAVNGVTRRPSYPVRGPTSGPRLLWQDLVALVRELPAVVRAVRAGMRLSRSQLDFSAPRVSHVARPELEAAPFHVPAACVRVGQAEWEAAAARLGGTSNSLLSAIAARLGQRFGRIGDDGRVTLAVPVSNRVEGDLRANALDCAMVAVDPAGLDRDLSGLRSATKAALRELADQSYERLAVLPLIPLTPRAVARSGERFAMGAGVSPVGCSNHGTVPPDALRIDGRDPDDFWVRMAEPGRTAAGLDRIGGQVYVLSGHALGRVYVSVMAWPVGGGLEAPGLRDVVIGTLAEFGLREVASTVSV